MNYLEDIENRIVRLRLFLEEHSIEAVLISKEANLHYFSGFTGDDSWLLVTMDKAYMITDSRYTEQAGQQIPKGVYEIIEHRQGLMNAVEALLIKMGLHIVGIEGNALTAEAYLKLAADWGDKPGNKIRVTELDALRIIKDPNELELLTKAVAISDSAYKYILDYIEVGMTEMQVAAELEHWMRLQGSERPAFTTIVASGVRGALPHGVASDKLINLGEFVTIDFGAVYKGYHSDITRTFCMGRADDKLREIYEVVLEAQLLGLREIAPGKTGREVDTPVREHIAKAGYGDYFGHGLGHGVGLEIHELPRLSPRAEIVLKENMVVTDEPGIYIPDWGGVRIEDTVLVTADACRPLTQSAKQLIEI